MACLTILVILGMPLALLEATGSAGTLDPTFGVRGRVVTSFGSPGNATALVRQLDGKLVVAGTAGRDGYDFALARYAADGTLDPSFGVGGKVLTEFGFPVIATDLVLQPDGKLVVSGTDVAGLDLVLARYDTDGTLDPTFGSGGKVTRTGFGPQAMVLRPDGKLVTAGINHFGTTADFGLARFNADGTLDGTFGVGGTATTDFDGRFEYAAALVLQPDGKLVAAGQTTDFTTTSRFALARYTVDGALDPTFGAGGKVTVDFNGAFSAALDVALQPDGKLVAAGSSGGAGDVALARVNSDGSLDATFGVGGQVTSDFGRSDYANALVVQPDGKLVVAGVLDDGDVNFLVARYHPDGTPDLTFGTNGYTRTGSSVRDEAHALLLQPDGKLVAAGVTIGSGFSLVRLNGDDVADTTPPAIDIVAPASTSYPLNATIVANYSCVDDVSLASCEGPVPSGGLVDTGGVGAKTFQVNASDSAGNQISQTVFYSVEFRVCLLYDPARAGKRGSTLPIKIQLCDAGDANRSTAEVVVTATDIQRISDATTSEVADPGSANPDSNFRFDPTLGGTGGYIYNLKTQGLATGTYALRFKAGSDPTTHQVQFAVR